MIRRIALVVLVCVAATLPAQTAAKPVARDSLVFANSTASLSYAIQPNQSITIMLTPYQQKQIAAYRASIETIQAQQQAFLSGIIGSIKDPGTIGDWGIVLRDSAIVLTPPAAKDSTNPKPSLPPRP